MFLYTINMDKNSKCKFTKNKNVKGITLVALVVTIIVLLFNDYLYIIKGDAPFSRRGGDYKNRTSGGIFNINSHNGEGFSSYKSMSC